MAAANIPRSGSVAVGTNGRNGVKFNMVALILDANLLKMGGIGESNKLIDLIK